MLLKIFNLFGLKKLDWRGIFLSPSNFIQFANALRIFWWGASSYFFHYHFFIQNIFVHFTIQLTGTGMKIRFQQSSKLSWQSNTLLIYGYWVRIPAGSRMSVSTSSRVSVRRTLTLVLTLNFFCQLLMKDFAGRFFIPEPCFIISNKSSSTKSLTDGKL